MSDSTAKRRKEKPVKGGKGEPEKVQEPFFCDSLRAGGTPSHSLSSMPPGQSTGKMPVPPKGQDASATQRPVPPTLACGGFGGGI